jgi:ankyrin repeat protein
MTTTAQVHTLSGNTFSIPDVSTIGELRASVAIELAVFQEQVKLACGDQLIVDNGASIARCCGQPITAFVTAVSVDAILSLIGQTDINCRLELPRRGTVLHFAALQGSLCFVETLLGSEQFKLFNDIDARGRTAVQTAAINGHTEVVKVMLSDSRIHNGLVLHSAAAWGRTETVETILASPHCTHELINSCARGTWDMEDGDTVLHTALKHEHPDVATMLLEDPRFTSLNNVTSSGGTALHIAAQHGDTRTVQALLVDLRFTEVDASDVKGCTALHRVAAAMEDYSEVTTAILDSTRFTKWDAKDGKGMTALETAVEKHCKETGKVLQAHAKHIEKKCACLAQGAAVARRHHFASLMLAA